MGYGLQLALWRIDANTLGKPAVVLIHVWRASALTVWPQPDETDAKCRWRESPLVGP